MSNHLAIATVTATLRDMLQEVASQAVSEATATIKRPEKAGDSAQDSAAVNIFLYQVTPNTAWRKDLTPIRSVSRKCSRVLTFPSGEPRRSAASR